LNPEFSRELNREHNLFQRTHSLIHPLPPY